MAPLSNDPFVIASLISRLRQGELTPGELADLDAWIAASDAHRRLWEELNNDDVVQQNVQSMARFNEAAALERFLANKPASKKVFRLPAFRRWQWVAAVFVLALGVASYFFLSNQKPITTLAGGKAVVKDIPPGKDGAILTLSDGSQLILDTMGAGTIATQHGTTISLQNNELVYDATAATGEVARNTITTPKGRQFHVVLPDATEVWLNAASSIEYPVAFKGAERRVKITGEVYFDVANRSWQPFIVETEQMKLEVLGTSFNINSYANEQTIQTTLLTGAVKVTLVPDNSHQHKTAHYKVLVPGQTSVLSKPGAQSNASLVVTDKIDAGKITAWKNGLFNFDGADLHSIMRQLERWYNIEVQYVGKPEHVIFKGKMHRNTNLSDVLKVLKTMDVDFELKGNILYVK
ncbi:FecR family protein [Filimonas effusa]|uniref:FecR family protein n=1 Tax=Filimonas effusa TaxID=2508721 RepID=A0A4Q1DCK1_9BACT|nr:FecR family protein [Filimonas effusa]RXK86575.1 FecR family protein [Filimonas effusa]